MPITDPFDKTKTYPTVRDLVKKYTPSVPSELLAIMIDEIRADRDGPEANIEITGGMTPVTVPTGSRMNRNQAEAERLAHHGLPVAWTSAKWSASMTPTSPSMSPTRA